MKLKTLLLNEATSYAGKTYICVDIQEEYQGGMFFKPFQFCEFLNKNFASFHDLVFLYNGPQLGFGDEDDYKMWLSENGLEQEVIDSSHFYDKGYAFFRYCMDSGVNKNATVNFVRFMYENDIHDSREMTRDMWAKYLREYRRLDRKEVYELLKEAGDCINIPDLMDYIKRFRNIVLTGGGVNECLKEVEIALQALRVPYEIDQEWTY